MKGGVHMYAYLQCKLHTEEDRIGRNVCCIKILLGDQVRLPPPTMLQCKLERINIPLNNIICWDLSHCKQPL